MPRLTVSKEGVEGQPLLPEGMYTVRCDGFKPKFSKDKQSKNLNPVLKVTNNAEYNDRNVYENLNTKADWIWKDFCHSFGVPIDQENGSYVFPGNFEGPDDQPEQWQYAGPLVGQLAQVYVVQVSDNNGGIKNAVKFYSCKLPACSLKHATSLVK